MELFLQNEGKKGQLLELFFRTRQFGEFLIQKLRSNSFCSSLKKIKSFSRIKQAIIDIFKVRLIHISSLSFNLDYKVVCLNKYDFEINNTRNISALNQKYLKSHQVSYF
jgi:hypothetical protein